MESVKTLINTINDEISRSLHKTLQPFVLQIEGDRQNYNAVLNVMRGLPEYKELVAENIVLKKRLEHINKPYDNDDDDIIITGGIVRSIKAEPPWPVRAEALQAPMLDKESLIEQIKFEVIEEISYSNDNIQDTVKQIYLDANLLDVKNLCSSNIQLSAEGMEDTEEEDEEEEESQEEEEEEEEEEKEEEEEEETVVEEENDEEDEEEVFIIEIIQLGVNYGNYYTTNATNGKIYQIEKNTEEVGIHAGLFIDGVPTLF